MDRRKARNAARLAKKQKKKDEKEAEKQPGGAAGTAASSSASASTSGAASSGGTRLTSAIAHGAGPWNPPAQSPAQSSTQSTAGQPNLPARARAARSALENILNDAGMSDTDFCTCCGNMLSTYQFAAGELGEGHLPVVVSGLPSGLAEKLAGKGPAGAAASAASAAAGSRPSSVFPPGFPNNMTSTVKAAINARNAPGVTMDDYINMAMNEAAGLAERRKNATNKSEGYDDTTYLAAMKAIREVTNNGKQRFMGMKKFVDFVKKPEVKAFFEEELAKENEGRCQDCYVTFDDDEDQDENEKQQSEGDGTKGKGKAKATGEGDGKGKGKEVETKAKVKAESKGKGKEAVKNEGESKVSETVIQEVNEEMEKMGIDDTEQGTSGGKGKNNDRVKERRKKYKAKKRQQKKDQEKEEQEKQAQQEEDQQKEAQQKEAQQKEAQQKEAQQNEAQKKEGQEKNELSCQQGTGTVDQSTQTDDFDWLIEFVSNAVMACSKRHGAEQPAHQGQQSARVGCQHLHDDCSFRDYYAAHFCTNCHKYHPSVHEDDNDDDDGGSDNDNESNDSDNDNDDDDDSDDLDLDHTRYIRSLKRKSKRLNTEANNEMASSPTLKDVFFPPISRKLWAAARYDRRAEWLSWNKEKWCGVMEYDAKPARAI